MKGFVPTPAPIVDRMVRRLFDGAAPKTDDVVIDPGAGEGAFIDGILRWARKHDRQPPKVVAVESHPDRIATLRARFHRNGRVRVAPEDFLTDSSLTARYVIGNPPYVPITGLSTDEMAHYRRRFGAIATGRTDLYLLFFAKALDCLSPGGRVVFVTPEKFLYVATAAPLRSRLSGLRVERVELLPEDAFAPLVTYPAITSVRTLRPKGATTFRLRDGRVTRARLPIDGGSWLPFAMRYRSKGGKIGVPGAPTLDDVSVRISAGIATGADGVFVVPSESVGTDLAPYAYPTISGRDLKMGAPMPEPSHSMLVPYMKDGRLQSPEEAGDLFEYLSAPRRRALLTSRTCASRKPWYAFHDSAPLAEIQRPKVVWKDISESPAFWVDQPGEIVPRHSVYYLVPKDPARLNQIVDYLSSNEAASWLNAHCQRAMKGFLRLQSNVLREMPVPQELVGGA